MKLDKIAFANVIAHISECIRNSTIDKHDITILDDLIDIDVPQPPMMNAETLHVLMALMQEGERKIEAIKQHRMMTGYGLKESKDVVEKYWQSSTSKKSEVEMLKHLNSCNYSDDDYNTINSFLNNAYR